MRVLKKLLIFFFSTNISVFRCLFDGYNFMAHKVEIESQIINVKLKGISFFKYKKCKAS